MRRQPRRPLVFDLPSQTKRTGPFTPSQVLCCVVPEMWGTEGSGAVVEASHIVFSASNTDSACQPAFTFLFKPRIDKCAFALKRS